jgi:hypothetical protein
MDLKKLFEQFEEIMSDSFMEEGEFETAKRMFNERHRVLLVLAGKESDTNALRYALNISRRIGAGIEILYLTKDSSKKPLLERYLEQLKSRGIGYRISPCERSVKEEVVKYIDTEKKADIRFVVIDSLDLGIRSVKDQKVSVHEWERQCPLVLVSETMRA